MEKMTKEQIDRYLEIESQKVEAINNVADSISDLSNSIHGALGSAMGDKYVLGIAQALFQIADKME